MVPGLSGQSRVGNNSELARLNLNCENTRPGYFYVRSKFQTEDPGWKIGKYARSVKLRAADALSDLLVFDCDNDLVVDMASMTEPGAASPPENTMHAFKANALAHHNNYFCQRETLDFTASRFNTP